MQKPAVIRVVGKASAGLPEAEGLGLVSNGEVG